MLAQFGAGMGDASLILGASAFTTFKRILLPLIAPAVLIVGLLTFVSAIRATTAVALVATEHRKPLSVLQLDQMIAGEFEDPAVVGALLVVLVGGAGRESRWPETRIPQCMSPRRNHPSSTEQRETWLEWNKNRT